MFLKMKLSEVTVDNNTLPTQHEMQIVKSIFDGNEKQVPITQPKVVKTTSSRDKNTLLTTIVVGFIITFLLLIQPSINHLFLTKVNFKPFHRFLPIFFQVVFSMFVFFLITKRFTR